MAEVRHSEKKRDIVEERLYRKLSEGGSRLKRIFVPIGGKLKEWFHRLYGKVARLQRPYRLKATTMIGAHSSDKQKQIISDLLADGAGFVDQENYKEAERKFIEAISLDNH